MPCCATISLQHQFLVILHKYPVNLTASMALSHLFTLLVTALAFSRIEPISCSVVKGSVLCTDCSRDYDFSGIRVLVKCDQVKKLSLATTSSNGAFETDLPSDAPASTPPTSMKCLAKLHGGPSQLYALKKDMVSNIVMPQGDQNPCTVLAPLAFSKSCHGKCKSGVGSSKTIDLPVPPEYGLPPTSYYTPFFPIIGIP